MLPLCSALLLGSSALQLAPAPAVHTRRVSVSPTCLVEVDPSQAQVLAGAAALLLSGGAIAYTQQASSSSSSSSSSPPSSSTLTVEARTSAPSAPEPAFKPAYTGKVTVGLHRMAGRAKPQPPREQWVPPPDWKPPKKPVVSWYDRGDRLTPDTKTDNVPPAPKPKEAGNFFEKIVSIFTGGGAAASAQDTPAKPKPFVPAYTGKVTVGLHRMAGRAKPPPPREQWVPPPGWEPPSKAAAKIGVQSWYDAGKRL